jgi:hypothetical protein
MTADLPESVADMLGTGSRCPSESTIRRILGDIDALAERPQPDQRPQPSPRTAPGLTGQDDCRHIDILPGGHGHLSQVSGLRGSSVNKRTSRSTCSGVVGGVGIVATIAVITGPRISSASPSVTTLMVRPVGSLRTIRQTSSHAGARVAGRASLRGQACAARPLKLRFRWRASSGVAGRTSGGLVGPRRRQFRRARHRCAGRSGRVNWASTPEGAGNADICGRLAAHGRLETIASACLMPRLPKT